MIVLGCTIRTRAGVEQWCWPDGRSYLEQEAPVPDIFSIVKEEIGAIMNE